MRSTFTAILLALNLAVFGYLYFSEHPWSATGRIEENRRRVLGPEAANLTALELLAPAPRPAPGAEPATPAASENRIHLERTGDAWFLTTPLNWPANDFAVRRILTALQFLEHETSFPVSDLARNGQTLADYGLADPRLIVTATPAPATPGTVAASPFTLKIGDGTAVGKNLYILSPDATRIHVVDGALAEALAPDLAKLRSDQLLTVPVFEARALTLQTSANTTRTRLRRDQTRWLFEAPITTRAAKTPVDLAINGLNALRVTRFLSPAETPAPDLTGLTAPRLRITLEGNARRETLLLGLPVKPAAPAGETIELFAQLDDRATTFTTTVPTELLNTLDRAQTTLRDRTLLDFDPALVTALSLAAPEPAPALRLQRLDATTPGTPAAWQLASPSLAAPLRADRELVEKLLRQLQLLSATAPKPGDSPFVSDAPTAAEIENLGFNRPERTLTLQLAPAPAAANSPASPPSTLVLQIASPGGADPGTYARILGQPFVYALRPETIDALPIAPRLWRERALQTLPPATTITRLVLRPATSDAAPLLEYSPSATPPPAPVATLLAALRDLRAQTLIREDYPATVPVDGVEKPWAYILEATLEPALPTGPLILTLAERSGGRTQFAGSPTLGLVFTLPQPVLDALWTLLYPAPPTAP